jgi:hypothetical protein
MLNDAQLVSICKSQQLGLLTSPKVRSPQCVLQLQKPTRKLTILLPVMSCAVSCEACGHQRVISDRCERAALPRANMRRLRSRGC